MRHAEQIETLKGLLERVRGATGADREIDFDVARWEGWTQHSDADDPVYTGRVSQWWAEPGCEWSTYSQPSYVTRSIDAALELAQRILPGAMWAVGCMEGGPFCRLVYPNARAGGWGHSVSMEQEGGPPTEALAILSALLSAKLDLLTREHADEKNAAA